MHVEEVNLQICIPVAQISNKSSTTQYWDIKKYFSGWNSLLFFIKCKLSVILAFWTKGKIWGYTFLIVQFFGRLVFFKKKRRKENQHSELFMFGIHILYAVGLQFKKMLLSSSGCQYLVKPRNHTHLSISKTKCNRNDNVIYV